MMTTDVKVRSFNERYVSEGSRMSINSGVKNYQFDEKMTSGRNKVELKGREKNNYNYNLFSIIDEPINSGCGSCTMNNEICAARRTNAPWN